MYTNILFVFEEMCDLPKGIDSKKFEREGVSSVFLEEGFFSRQRNNKIKSALKQP